MLWTKYSSGKESPSSLQALQKPEILRRVKGGNPQMMAEDILALAVGQEEPRDDMTVLVAAIQSRN